MELVQTLIPITGAFALTVIFMPLFIGYMRFKKEGQMIREEGPKWHEKKSGTPTMGGVVFIVAIALISVMSAVWQHHLNASFGIALAIFLLYGALGFLDDFMKLAHHQNEGLKAWQKLLGQLVGAGALVAVYLNDGLTHQLYLPFIGMSHATWLFVAFSIVWLVGFSNAVNLSDGLDGLVAGLSFIAFGTYAVIAYHDGRVDLLVLALSVVGAMVGFFMFNHKPAKIFMGDVGSLALGGLIAAMALLLDRPWSLLLIGIVFVIETASVILQVASFKLTGKRLFKMSPIHHHFEMLGWSEWKVDLVFWSVGLIGSVVYLLIFL